MVKSKGKNISAIRIAVVACGLLLGFGGDRLVKSDTISKKTTHSACTAYTQSDGDTIVEYSGMTKLACADDL